MPLKFDETCGIGIRRNVGWGVQQVREQERTPKAMLAEDAAGVFRGRLLLLWEWFGLAAWPRAGLEMMEEVVETGSGRERPRDCGDEGSWV
jgi:hypothetical protein